MSIKPEPVALLITDYDGNNRCHLQKPICCENISKLSMSLQEPSVVQVVRAHTSTILPPASYTHFSTAIFDTDVSRNAYLEKANVSIEPREPAEMCHSYHTPTSEVKYHLPLAYLPRSDRPISLPPSLRRALLPCNTEGCRDLWTAGRSCWQACYYDDDNINLACGSSDPLLTWIPKLPLARQHEQHPSARL